MNHSNLFSGLNFQIGNARIDIMMQPGFFRHDRGWHSDVHCHYAYEAHYIEKGTAELILSGKPVVLPEGSFTVVSPYLYHYTAYRHCEIVKISFLFRVKKIKAEEGAYDFFSDFTGVLEKTAPYATFPCNTAYWNALLHTVREAQAPDPLVSEKRKNLFSLAFIDFTQSAAARAAPPGTAEQADRFGRREEDNVRRMQIEAYIDTNYRGNLTLEDLAGHLFLSERQAARIVREVTGLSFNKAVQKHRMECAKRMLLERTPIKDIWVHLGYSSYGGFYKAFQKYTGTAPALFCKER